MQHVIEYTHHGLDNETLLGKYYNGETVFDTDVPDVVWAVICTDSQAQPSPTEKFLLGYGYEPEDGGDWYVDEHARTLVAAQHGFILQVLPEVLIGISDTKPMRPTAAELGEVANLHAEEQRVNFDPNALAYTRNDSGEKEWWIGHVFGSMFSGAFWLPLQDWYLLHLMEPALNLYRPLPQGAWINSLMAATADGVEVAYVMGANNGALALADFNVVWTERGGAAL